MSTENGYPGTEKKTRLWGILSKRFRTVRRSKPIRPIPLFIAMLAALGTILAVIGLAVSMGSVQATAGDGFSAEPLARTTLGPFLVTQPPDFMIYSGKKDIAIQKVTISEGGHSGWHTHPGLTIVIVGRGRLELTRFTEEDGCIVQVFGPEEPEKGFAEVADEVHIARNIGDGEVVIYNARLNFPVGGDITDSSPEGPGC